MFHHYRRLVAVVFALLGFQVGLRAVQLADLAIQLQLTAGELGVAASAGAVSGILTLVAGAALIDRIGRRAVLLLGLIGSGLSLLLTAAVVTYPQFLAVSVGYGLLVSFLDLAANALGSDAERACGQSGMVGFNSWFSLAAAGGALLSGLCLGVGLDFRPAFVFAGAVSVIGGVWSGRASLPPVISAPPVTQSHGVAATRWSWPVYAAVTMVFLCFFGDGILETFLAVFVRAEAATPVWASGLTLGLFHLASWLGRAIAQGQVLRWGERAVLMTAGVVAAGAMTAATWLTQGWLATAGIAVVGLALAPIIPLAMSLAGRHAPAGVEGRAIGITNAVGYSAFVLGPGAAGALADHASLVVALSLPILTMVAVSVVAWLLPRTTVA